MTDVRLDRAALQDAADRIRRLGGDLERSEALQGALVDAAGHERLRDALGAFAHGWRVSRGELADRLRALEHRASAIAETVAELDRAMADGLTAVAREEGRS
ncbi:MULTISPECIES: hypothetical protein [unclassified Microcella]|uniref:hypothetical protein n=1 Tax=unclassified Microcella TaxID=2630066 RepID=UPI0006F88302|nr:MULTISPECIES: hypothetical protein [unclassified Microcella]KQV24538.1 hypothetical protein ASC54_08345 [Yonghaparkia sp. Root332]KRF30830.1 hypothetical protein ASG83_08175 [Yonghaparkia sp. Soil809]